MFTFADPKIERIQMTNETQNTGRFAEYRSSIEELAHEKVDFEFGNSSAKHAAVVLANILKTSDSVCIYDTHLEGDIAYEHVDFLSSLSTFLKTEGKSLRIVIREFADVRKARLYSALSNLKSNIGDLDIRLVSPEFVSAATDYAANHTQHSDVNFAVGDGRAYRLEMYNGRPNGRFHKARCNFNGTDTAGSLTAIFDEHFDSCEEVAV